MPKRGSPDSDGRTMNGTPFKLATFAKPNAGTNAKPFAAIVLGEQAVDLSAAHAAYRAARGGQALSATDSIFGLLESWDANLPILQEIIAFLEKEGLPAGTAPAAGLRAL